MAWIYFLGLYSLTWPANFVLALMYIRIVSQLISQFLKRKSWKNLWKIWWGGVYLSRRILDASVCKLFHLTWVDPRALEPKGSGVTPNAFSSPLKYMKHILLVLSALVPNWSGMNYFHIFYAKYLYIFWCQQKQYLYSLSSSWFGWSVFEALPKFVLSALYTVHHTNIYFTDRCVFKNRIQGFLPQTKEDF